MPALQPAVVPAICERPGFPAGLKARSTQELPPGLLFQKGEFTPACARLSVFGPVSSQVLLVENESMSAECVAESMALLREAAYDGAKESADQPRELVTGGLRHSIGIGWLLT